jgi:dTDP-4-dehydrorhamnose reductase
MSEAEVTPEKPVEKPRLRILILGGSGMLGTEVDREARRRGHDVKTPPREELDIGNADHLEKLRRRDWGNLDWVINCAAYTAVDEAEKDPWVAQKINGTAPGILAFACASHGWRLVQVSTDFVFDGSSSVPYTEDRPTNPLGAYGRSKEFGERLALKEDPNSIIARTSWLYGPFGKSFPKTILKAWMDGRELKVVNDQFGCPTYSPDLARVLVDMVESAVPGGIYHCSGPESMSWNDFAGLAIEAWRDHVDGSKPQPEIAGVSTEDWPTPAKRPANSTLDCSKLYGAGIQPMRPTNEALADFVVKIPKPL